MADGLDADVVTMNQPTDIDFLADRGGSWPRTGASASRQRAPYTSTMVFLVRKGNPKGIKDWDDLAKPGVQVDRAEPQDLRQRPLGLPAAWGYALRRRAAATRRRASSSPSCTRTCRCSTRGGRGATTTFPQRGHRRRADHVRERGVSDRRRSSAPTSSTSSIPRSASWRSRPVAVVEHGRRQAGHRARSAEAYLDFLYSPTKARRSPPSTTSARATRRCCKKLPTASRPIKLFTVEELFGGWAEAQTDALRRRRRSTRSSSPDEWRAAACCRQRAGLTTAQGAARASGCRWAFTLVYLSPDRADPAVGACSCKTVALSSAAVLAAPSASPRVLASYRLSFGASLLAAAVNAVFGLLVAWVLVRYRFPGQAHRRRAGRPAVRAADRGRRHRADRALCARTAGSASYLEPLGIKVAFTPLGIVVALIFIGLPFVVRTVQPVLEDARPRARGGRRQPRRHPLADLPPRDPADARCRRCSPASRWPSRAPSANTAR